MENLITTLNQFIIQAGLIVGLGAVTVIDLHGFLARKSEYWTLATTRAHKITKPLIWLGTILFTIGTLHYNYFINEYRYFYLALVLMTLMILNGLFLTFYVSKILLKREKLDQAEELLPNKLQNYIKVSFAISFVCWWTQVIIYIVNF